MERPQAAGRSDRTKLAILKLSLIPVADSMHAQLEASSVEVLMIESWARSEEIVNTAYCSFKLSMIPPDNPLFHLWPFLPQFSLLVL